MTTGIVKNADTSYTLTSYWYVHSDGSPVTETIPAGTSVATANQMALTFFRQDFAYAFNSSTGFPLDNLEGLLAGSMITS